MKEWFESKALSPLLPGLGVMSQMRPTTHNEIDAIRRKLFHRKLEQIIVLTSLEGESRPICPSLTQFRCGQEWLLEGFGSLPKFEWWGRRRVMAAGLQAIVNPFVTNQYKKSS